MLRKHSDLFKNLLFISDLTIISLTWVTAYYVRFYSNLIPLIHDFTPLKPYLLLLVPILLIWGLIFKVFNLYRPRRLSSHLEEIFDISKACTLAVIILVATTFFMRQHAFSRLVFLYFWVFTIFALSFSRAVFREILRFIRKQGYNLRHVMIIGDGNVARELVQRLHNHPELGLNIIGVLGKHHDNLERKIDTSQIIGTYDDIGKIMREQSIDHVFIATPIADMESLENILGTMSDYPVTIQIIPDIQYFLPFCGGVEEFDGLPILSLQDTPLYGWNMVLKRLSDIVVASISIIVSLPIFAVIAAVIKLTSPGPILYRQERAGLDGKIFTIFKFRTMGENAEKETGPIWAKEEDERRTRFGTFLRKSSLDELPQFFNVLKGEMSVVGPRPERPQFINKFKDEIPRYMLRHKVKTGITGWAQVNGWRGNTDLKKRIEHDLYYIENWSLWFDIKIIVLTIFKGLVNKHAY